MTGEDALMEDGGNIFKMVTFVSLLFLSEADISLDMGVCSSPHHEVSFKAETPSKRPGRSSPSTPPPKKNKVERKCKKLLTTVYYQVWAFLKLIMISVLVW